METGLLPKYETMRKLSISISISVVISLMSCSQKTEKEFLDLNMQQLRKIGITINDQGLFYKNNNIDWEKDNQRYEILGFYCIENNYSTIVSIGASDTLSNKLDSTFLKMDITRNNFYPLFITNQNLKPSFETYSDSQPEELLPIRIFMENAALSNRKDTIIVWFKPTEMLKEIIPEIKIDNYLRILDIKH